MKACVSPVPCVSSGGRYIEVFHVGVRGQARMPTQDGGREKSFTRTLKEDEEEEDVSESGRLFIRNLPYTCTEEEIRERFTKHGTPLSSSDTHTHTHTDRMTHKLSL